MYWGLSQLSAGIALKTFLNGLLFGGNCVEQYKKILSKLSRKIPEGVPAVIHTKMNFTLPAETLTD